MPKRTRIFNVSTQDASIPVIMTDQELEKFCAQGLSSMDKCLEHLQALRTIPGVDMEQPSLLDVVAEMIKDGADSANARKMVLCAQWLAIRHPEITGANTTGECAKLTREKFSAGPSAGGAPDIDGVRAAL